MNTKTNQKENENMKEQDNPFGKIIYAYTRKEAILDGVLVDVTETAHEAGFKWPVALTAEVWALIENIPQEHCHEDIQGRLWDVLWMGRLAISQAPRGHTEARYTLVLHQSDCNEIQLKIVSGPGDDGDPVLTIMLPDQD